MKKNTTIFQLRLKGDKEVVKSTRNDWGIFNPRTRIVESKKVYKRSDKSWKNEY